MENVVDKKCCGREVFWNGSVVDGKCCRWKCCSMDILEKNLVL